jgi:hypothetical protein
MNKEMFDEQGRFAGNGVHVQVFDHSKELPAVEVLDAKAKELLYKAKQRFIDEDKCIMESLR